MNTDSKFLNGIRLIGLGLISILIWYMLVEVLRHSLYHQITWEQYLKAVGDPVMITVNNAWGSFFFACISAPIFEEAFFRYGIIGSVRKANKKDNPSIMWPVVIMSSLLFGWMHHNMNELYVLNQGVAGLVFAIVYIRSGYQLWTAIVLHSLLNFMLIYGMPYLVK